MMFKIDSFNFWGHDFLGEILVLVSKLINLIQRITLPLVCKHLQNPIHPGLRYLPIASQILQIKINNRSLYIYIYKNTLQCII